MIELKGKDAFMVSNHVNCIIASNSSWVVPVGNKERRFFVLDVGEDHIQDHDYFEKIDDQMNNEGGIEAMMNDLLEVDITRHNLREAQNEQDCLISLFKILRLLSNFGLSG